MTPSTSAGPAGPAPAPNRLRALMTPSRWAAAAVVVLALVAGPGLLGAFWTRVITVCVVYAIAAAGTGVLYGRLGMVSLGQVSLLGVGAWVTLRVGHAGLAFEVAVLTGALVTAVIGVLVGLPALRLSGLNLAIVTLMLAGAFEVVFNITRFPNGGPGLLGRATSGQTVLPRTALGTSDPAYFRYVVVVAVAVFVVLAVHLTTRPGRAWAAIRQSEAGALAAGVGTVRYRLWALAVVSATTGLAGGLLAGVDGLMDPITFPASQSILLFATVLVGGTYSLWGAVVAGLLMQGMPRLLSDVGVSGDLVFVILGLATVQAILTTPDGVAGQVSRLSERIGGASRRTSSGPPAQRPPRPDRHGATDGQHATDQPGATSTSMEAR